MTTSFFMFLIFLERVEEEGKREKKMMKEKHDLIGCLLQALYRGMNQQPGHMP